MNWLNNAWVVGIGGGVLSGLLVTWLSRFFLSKREDREFQQRVQSANREIIYSIRPGISEGILPSEDVVDSLVRATSRRYSVKPADLYGPAEIAEELTKDVMDSSFLSAKSKNDYCEQLKLLREHAILAERDATREEPVKSAEAAHKTSDAMSLAIGLITTMMTIYVTLQEKYVFSSDRLLLPGVLSLFAVVMAMGLPMLRRGIKRRVESPPKPLGVEEKRVESEKKGEAKNA